MLNANEIRNSIEQEFQKNFDFEKFDNYLNDYFITQKKNHLYIGLEYDRHFKNGIPNIGYGKEYIWDTKIQVPVRYYTQVKDYLIRAGFKISVQGAPGYNDYDVIIVSV